MSTPQSVRSVHELISRFLKAVPSLAHTEAAGLLGVDPATIQNWREGRLPKQRLAGSTKAALERYLAAGEGGGVMAYLEEAARAIASAKAAYTSGGAVRPRAITPADARSVGTAIRAATDPQAKGAGKPAAKAVGGRRRA